MYAIIRTGGKQYRVRAGDRIAVERLTVDEGAEITLDDVLAVGDDDGATTVGTPSIAGASVTARVEAQGLGRKVTNFRFRNKTRYQRRRGHRQQQTELVITAINGG